MKIESSSILSGVYDEAWFEFETNRARKYSYIECSGESDHAIMTYTS